MTHIEKLVDRATSTTNTKPLKVGNYTAVNQDGVNCFVTSFYDKGEHFATLSISNPSSLGVTLDRYKGISNGTSFLKKIKEIYPNVVDNKHF